MCSPAGHAFDVKEALDKGGGTIVTDDPGLAALLTNYEPLQPADVPEDAEPVEIPGRDTLEASKAEPWTPQHGDPSHEVSAVGGGPEAVVPVHVEPDNPTDDPTGDTSSDPNPNISTSSGDVRKSAVNLPDITSGSSGQSSEGLKH